ncbi:response regulator [bacterium]|nr:response regulator [bacterium]
MRVLLVEDNSVDREVMAQMLNRMGHQVVQSRHGLDALSRLEQDRVDAVVLDLFMPILNGLETMEQIRKLQGSRTIPIVVVSGADPELAQECLDAGANAFLSKPCSQQELARKLERGCPSLQRDSNR